MLDVEKQYNSYSVALLYLGRISILGGPTYVDSSRALVHKIFHEGYGFILQKIDNLTELLTAK